MRGKLLQLLFAAASICAAAVSAEAAPTTVSIAEVRVSGVENPGGLKDVLGNLLASRLTSDSITVLDKGATAEVNVVEEYVEIGKHFSIDVTARDTRGKVLAREFEQGDGKDDLIPAIGKVARKLAAAIAKTRAPEGAPAAAATTATIAAPMVAAPAPAVPAVPVAEVPAAPVAAPAPAVSDIIKAPPSRKGTHPALIPRIEGELTGIAPVRELANGEREVFVTSLNSFALYRVGGKKDELLFKKEFPADTRVLALDYADLDGDGIPEAFLTMVTAEALASQVWKVQGETVQMVQGGLPYYFRGMSLAGGARKIYVQQMGMNDDFYGKIYELRPGAKGYEAADALKLPASASLYNFNIFRDSAGAEHVVVMDQGGKLTVYSPAGEELWRSSVKYGGSTVYFEREDLSNVRVTDSRFRRVYLQQRILVTADGDLIVPQNEGTFGKSFDRNALFALTWNGAAMEEKWHTKVDEGYLSDYFQDPTKKELILLQVVKKAGPFSKGASAIVVKRIE